jgi:hypothetical protein
MKDFAIHKFFYILSSNSKTAKVTKYSYTYEIFASEVDPSTAEKDQDFLQSFDFEGRYWKTGVTYRI